MYSNTGINHGEVRANSENPVQNDCQWTSGGDRGPDWGSCILCVAPSSAACRKTDIRFERGHSGRILQARGLLAAKPAAKRAKSAADSSKTRCMLRSNRCYKLPRQPHRWMRPALCSPCMLRWECNFRGRLRNKRKPGPSSTIRTNLEKGDLVFFNLDNTNGTATFDGIYLGGNQFAALTTHGLRVINLSDSYWSGKFLYGRRVL